MSAASSDLDHQAVIGVGSNISPRENISSALYLISHRVKIEAVSTIWLTKAIGSSGPDFLNTAILISTGFNINQLRKGVLKPIEHLLGRVRTQDPNAPRTIDLDILIYDGIILDAQLWNYPHTAVPAAELVPELEVPNTGLRAAEIAAALRDSSGITEAGLDLHWASTP